MQLHEILSHVADELPNSFTKDFKAQVKTMDSAQFVALWDALVRAHDTFTTEQREAFRAAHSVNRGAW